MLFVLFNQCREIYVYFNRICFLRKSYRWIFLYNHQSVCHKLYWIVSWRFENRESLESAPIVDFDKMIVVIVIFYLKVLPVLQHFVLQYSGLIANILMLWNQFKCSRLTVLGLAISILKQLIIVPTRSAGSIRANSQRILRLNYNFVSQVMVILIYGFCNKSHINAHHQNM